MATVRRPLLYVHPEDTYQKGTSLPCPSAFTPSFRPSPNATHTTRPGTHARELAEDKKEMVVARASQGETPA